MANNQHNPNMMVHSTNGLVDTTSSQSNDENHSRQGNNVAGSGNILERAITNNVFASSSSSSSSVLLPSVPASASSTVHALADSVMIPFSASDLDVLRASLAATNSLNNNNSNNDNTSGVLTSNPSDSSNINVCINGGNIIVNSDGHLTLDGATNAVLNGISSSNMVGVGIPNISVSVTQAAASSDLLHSSSNEISSNSGVNGLDPHQQQHRRMNNIVSNNQFFNASSSNNSGLDSNSVNDGNRMRNAGHIINNSNDNKNGGGVVSGASNPISIAGILANVNIDESGMVAAASNGFMPHAQNSNGVDSNQNAGGSSLSQNYATLRNQISSVKSSSNNSNASKPLYKSGRSLLSGNSNSLLQQHLKRDIAGGGISGSGNSLIGSSIGIVSGGGNSGSSIVERTATANIHHHASGRSNISSSSASSSGKRISLPSQMNLGGRVVSSSDSNGTINARAGTSQQGQAGPSSSSSIWLQQQQHQAPQNQHILSASQQNGSGLASQGPIRVNSSSTLTSSTVNLDQHGGEGGVVSISIAGDLPQQQIVQLGSAPNSSFQSQNQAFSGLFQIPVQQEEASVTFQAAAHSTFDQQTAGPSNLNIHQYRDLAVGGDSEAIPSYPSIQQPPYQIMASDNSIAESLNGAAAPTVDSSSIQSYNLVYDTETKKLTVQRVISPSDSTVSQSTLEGSEATPNPALMPTVSQGGYAMVQVNSMPSAFSQGGSGAAAMAGGSGASSSGGGGGEVSTSSMGVVLGLDDHRASSSALGGSIDSRLSSSSSSAARNIVVLHHKLEDNSLDTAECDTTQEDVEFQHPQTPPPYSLTGASNSIDDNEVTSLDSSMPDTPVSSLTHRRMMNHHIMRGQGSSSLSSSTRGDVMDATLNSSGLSSVVAMDTTEGHSVINMDTGQASSLSSSSTPVVSQQHHHHQRPKQQHHHQTNGQLMQAAIDILPSTSGLQAFDATAMAGPSHMYSENQQDETMPQSSGLGMNVRKSRRLELQEQEPRASQRKKDYSYRTQSYSVNLLWCDECMLSYDFECPTHRPSPVVDKMVLSRAWASCPTQLQICRLVDTAHESSESAMGVFAKRQIGKLTQFGPFVGKLVDTLDEVASCAFPLMVEMESGAKKYFDTSDENLCNWMMFVRPAKTFAEQNMVAFQHKEHVYFTVTKMIESKQELKIWYAAHYAERLHLKPLELTEEDMQVLDESDAKFPCFECSRRFRSSAALQKHLEMVHENEDLLDLNVDGDGVKDGMYDDEDGDYKGTINGMDGRGRGGDEEGVGSRRRRKNKGVIIQGKLIQGKGKSRQRENFQWKKKSTSLYINKTLKKCKKRVQCSDKSPAFGRSSMYKRQGKDNGGNEWVCTHCGLTFDKRSLLNLHTLTHAAEDLVAGEEGMMQIDPANSQFNKVETNQEEGVILTLGPMIACPKCAVIFTDQRDLMNHVATHAQKPLVKREKPFECLYCSKSFQTEDKLTKHSIVHGADEDKPLECGVCQKRLVNNAAMACHMKTHSDRKYYDCPVCDEDFDSSLELREHGQKLHSDEKGHYPCHNCIKVFDDFQMLKRHIKAFHSTRVFECDFCSKEFSRFDKLKLHMLKHTPHREFMCDQCGRQFKRKDKLKEHTKRLHSKERIEEELKLKENGAQPTISKFVPKVMPSEYHRFIYKCHSCLLGFKRRGMLVNHLAKRHPDMKPEHVPELNLPILKTQKDFYCQYCDKIYKSSSKRKAHILKIHPGSLVPPSARKKLPLAEDGSATVNGNVLPSGITVGANGQQVLPPSSTFSHTVGSITTMPHGCKFCHKQYASKAKLLQHQRKKHTELVEPSSAKKKSKPFKSEYLQITVADPTVALINERYETVPMVTVVTQATPGADQLTGPADLLTQAMTEIQQSYGGDFATAINPRLSAGNNNATMVQIQPSSLGQTIDINQLNQALQSMTSVASQGGVTTVLAPPQHTSILAPPQQQQQQQQLQQQQQQQLQQQQQPHPIQLIANSANGNAHPSTQQLQPGVQLVAAGGPGIQTSTINLSGLGGSQFITSRNWPNSFTSQFS